MNKGQGEITIYLKDVCSSDLETMMRIVHDALKANSFSKFVLEVDGKFSGLEL